MSGSGHQPWLRSSLFLLVFLLTRGADAQSVVERKDFSVERFRLTPSRLGVIDVESGRVLPHLGWDLGLQLNLSHDPLALYDSRTGRQVGSLVRNRLAGSLVGAIGLFDWVEVGLELPLTLFQERPGNQPNVTSSALSGLSAIGIGDLRIAPKVRLLRADKHKVDLALAVPFRVPTGFSREYLGEPGITFNPELALSRHFLAKDALEQYRGLVGFVFALNVGLDLRKRTQVANQIVEHELTYRVGIGYRFKEQAGLPGWLRKVWADLALHGTTSLVQPFKNANQNSMEIRVQGSYEISDRLLAFAGVGVGILRGFGTPDVRGFLGVRFGNTDPQPEGVARTDRDGDGLDDDIDRCPEEFEAIVEGDPRDGCPVKDTDGDGLDDVREKQIGTNPNDADSDDDGVIDGQELEPDQDSDGDGSKNALDPDSDNDHLPDGLELGVTVAHKDCDTSRGLFVADSDPLTRTHPLKPDTDNGSVFDGEEDQNRNGRLDLGERDPVVAADDIIQIARSDKDGDGVFDDEDQCVEQAIGTNEDPNRKGCPQLELVVVKDNKLDLLEPIRFETGSDVIVGASEAILNKVADILARHPEYTKINVDGHTDNQGGLEMNQSLSQKRAASVVRYLVAHGIAQERLVARGYGQTRPVSSNTSAQGRERNRRVEFVIAERAE